MNVRNVMRIAAILSLALASFACSQIPLQRSTQVAAGTGGAIGAGLGALIGSTTGDAGAGLVLGGTAGVAAGALVGEEIAGQQMAMNQRRERIERQEQIIRSQSSELEELRGLANDNVSFRDDPRRAPATNGAIQERSINPPVERYRDIRSGQYLDSRAARGQNQYEGRARLAKAPVVETVPIESRTGQVEGSVDRPVLDTPQVRFKGDKLEAPSAPRVEEIVTEREPTVVAKRAPIVEEPTTISVATPDVPEPQPAITEIAVDADADAEEEVDNASLCGSADGEVEKARQASVMSRKLYHYRRALRYCPGRADLHVELGQALKTAGRLEAAIFEFQEALRVNPNDELAQRELRGLNGGKSYQG